MCIRDSTHTCYKRNKYVCRFGAPFWPMDKTRILNPSINKDPNMEERYKLLHRNLENESYESFDEFLTANMVDSVDEYLEILRHGIVRPMVFLKRSIKDIWINPFNVDISAIIQSNTVSYTHLDVYKRQA